MTLLLSLLLPAFAQDVELSPSLSKAWDRRHMEWSGAGRVHRGVYGLRTRRFAKLVGDADIVDAIDRERLWLLPGGVVAGVGVVATAAGVTLITFGVVVFMGEAMVCVLTLGQGCDFNGSTWLFDRGALVGAIGLGTTAAGAVLFGVSAAVLVPRLKLARWYTPEDVKARVDAYNANLREELGLPVDHQAWVPRGGVELVVGPGTVGLTAVF